MAFALQRYRMHKARILDAGYTIPVVRPAAVVRAAFLRGISELMLT